MNCKRCGANAIKYGKSGSEQTYRCTKCGYHFTDTIRSRSFKQKKIDAKRLLLSGNSVTKTAKKVDVSERTIRRWMSDFMS